MICISQAQAEISSRSCVSNSYFLVHFVVHLVCCCNNIIIHNPQSIYEVGGGPTLATSIFPIRSGKNTNYVRIIICAYHVYIHV